MTHSDVRQNLADYLEGDLALDQRALVDAHLDGCEDCSQEVTEMQQTIRLLRMLPEPEAPPMIAANVMRRIRAGETQPSRLRRFGRGLKSIFEPSFVLPASAIAAAALVVVIAQDPGRLDLSQFQALTLGEQEQAVERGAVLSGVATLDRRGAVAGGARSAGLDSVVTGTVASGGGSGANLNPRWVEPTRSDLLTNRPLRRSDSPARESVYADPMLAARATPPSHVQQADERFRADYYNNANNVNRLPNGAGNAGPPATFVMDRMTAVPQSARAVTQSRTINGAGVTGLRERSTGAARYSMTTSGQSATTSGGEDARDLWIARGLADPVGFAEFIAEQNLAEQELWVARLSERAETRGLLAELTEALRSSGDSTANWLADDFEAEVDRLRGRSAPVEATLDRSDR